MRLRQCSKYSRNLVDKSPYFIPRIRFHGKENRFLLAIFPDLKREIWLKFIEIDLLEEVNRQENPRKQ